MSRESIRVDVLSELLEGLNVSLTREQIEQLASDFYGHIEMEREIESYQFMGSKTCSGCEEKRREIDKLEHKLNLFIDAAVKFSRVTDGWASIENDRVVINQPLR
jgi:hypothetical protein